MELVVYHGSVTVNLIGEGYYVVQVIFAPPPCLFTFFPMKWKCSWTEIYQLSLMFGVFSIFVSSLFQSMNQ